MSTPDRSKCQSLLNSLCDYVDGTLSDVLCQDIEQHLAECSDCRIMVDTMRKTILLVHGSSGESAKVPGQVRERLFKTLKLEDYLKH